MKNNKGNILLKAVIALITILIILSLCFLAYLYFQEINLAKVEPKNIIATLEQLEEYTNHSNTHNEQETNIVKPIIDEQEQAINNIISLQDYKIKLYEERERTLTIKSNIFGYIKDSDEIILHGLKVGSFEDIKTNIYYALDGVDHILAFNVSKQPEKSLIGSFTAKYVNNSHFDTKEPIKIDSKTILNVGGAERLLGKGDMLYQPSDSPELKRIQGAFLSNEEIKKIVSYIKENNEAEFDEEIEKAIFSKSGGGYEINQNEEEFDPLLKDALRIAIKTDSASISKLQRAFGIGYPRAGKIIDQMERSGMISPPDNKNARTIYMTQQEFEERFGEDL